MLAIGDSLAGEYLAGEHPQQEEVHLRALTFDYLYRWAQLNREWAEPHRGRAAPLARYGAERRQAPARAGPYP